MMIVHTALERMVQSFAIVKNVGHASDATKHPIKVGQASDAITHPIKVGHAIGTTRPLKKVGQPVGATITVDFLHAIENLTLFRE